MSTLRQKLDYNLDMVAHYGAGAFYRAGLWHAKGAARSDILDMQHCLDMAKRAKEAIDA